MKDWAWIASAVGALGIITTFAAGVIGKRQERNAAHTAWLRENRLRSYGDLLDGANDLADTLVAFAESRSAPDDERLSTSLWATTKQMVRVADRIRILGPKAMADEGVGLYDQAVALVKYARRPDGIAALKGDTTGNLGTIPIVDEYLAACNRFADLARHVLDGEKQ